ncbi:Nicotinate-nucleotide adenylyltransferase [hydrothermal vent metagenome]|uniref:Nicotinate-nucleotide adenylyltransferase n=1 Tax=hydrothermal vent metagenome TaxID=652676 RepID=A0A3B0XDR1_9ZZZZ
MSRLTGVFGGTFDPIHYGHLRPALDVLQGAGLDEVRFIPNRLPPHRDAPYLNDPLRAELVQLAIAETPEFLLDKRELQRDGPSYMVDTLESLKSEFPADTLCLIMGMDAFNGLPQWHRWQTILELCHLIVTTRPGAERAAFAQQAAISARFSDDSRCLERRSAGQILLQSVTQLDISASRIRQSLRRGQSIQYLLPEALREKLEQAYAKHNK